METSNDKVNIVNFLLTKTFHINKKYLKGKTDKIYYEKDFIDIKLLKDSINFITFTS